MKKYVFLLITLSYVLRVAAQTGLEKGAKAPEFIEKDNSGKLIDLTQLLKGHKYVVLFFYRGQWCPYCNKQIKELQDSLQLLTAKGAYVIGVTPETNENIDKTIEKTHAAFSIIHDKGYKIMQAYQVNYTVGDETFSKLKSFGIDLEKNNGNTDRVLPVPATYIIDKTRNITYVHFDKDYKKRASVSSLLSALN